MAADVRLAIALLALLGIAVAVLTAAGVTVRRQVVGAAGRAAVQLTLIGFILGAVFRFPAATAAVLAVMLGTASRTAARRLSTLERPGRAVLLSCVVGVIPVLVVVFGTGALDLSARYVVALSGITLGGTMTACTVAGRQLIAGLRSRRDEVEDGSPSAPRTAAPSPT